MRKYSKFILGVTAATAVAAPMALAAPANAYDGQQLIVGGGFDGAVQTQTLADFGFSTDFAQTLKFTEASHPGGDGSMWDPGTYVIGTNPRTYHPFWVDFGANADDPMLIVNGFQTTNQKVLETTVSTDPAANCTTGSKVTFDFQANAANILPLSAASDGGAKISVTINNTSIGSADLTSNNPNTPVQIVGSVPWAPSFDVKLWNNGTAYSGNDFAIDDITLTQRGQCEPPCEPTVKGVWFNYTGKFTGNGAPALNDPKWHALPAQPGGEHALSLRGFDKPYQPGKDNGKGDWFVWKNLGTTCPAA